MKRKTQAAALELALIIAVASVLSAFSPSTKPDLSLAHHFEDEDADLCINEAFPVCLGEPAYYASMISMYCSSTFPPGCCQYKLWEYQCEPNDPILQILHKYWYSGYRCLNNHCVP